MVYVQRELSKHKLAKIVVKIESKAIIFKLLQQEQFEEEIMSLKAKKKNFPKTANSYNSHLSWMRKDLFVPKAE